MKTPSKLDIFSEFVLIMIEDPKMNKFKLTNLLLAMGHYSINYGLCPHCPKAMGPSIFCDLIGMKWLVQNVRWLLFHNHSRALDYSLSTMKRELYIHHSPFFLSTFINYIIIRMYNSSYCTFTISSMIIHDCSVSCMISDDSP